MKRDGIQGVDPSQAIIGGMIKCHKKPVNGRGGYFEIAVRLKWKNEESLPLMEIMNFGI
jgi:hypothetical protein